MKKTPFFQGQTFQGAKMGQKHSLWEIIWEIQLLSFGMLEFAIWRFYQHFGIDFTNPNKQFWNNYKHFTGSLLSKAFCLKPYSIVAKCMSQQSETASRHVAPCLLRLFLFLLVILERQIGQIKCSTAFWHATNAYYWKFTICNIIKQSWFCSAILLKFPYWWILNYRNLQWTSKLHSTLDCATLMLEEIQGTNGWLCYGRVTEDFVRPLRSRKGHKVAFDTPNCDPLRERNVTGHYCFLESWQWKISGCVPKNPRCRLFPRLHKSC